MITAYLDGKCKELATFRVLSIDKNYSAIWFDVSQVDDIDCFLNLTVSMFSSYKGYLWLSHSGTSESLKVIEFKRAFGIWNFSREDVVFQNEIYDSTRNKCFSDVAILEESNSGLAANLLNRSLFGIDSSLFFLPKLEKEIDFSKIVNNLEKLYLKRESSNIISEEINKDFLIESYIEKVVDLRGIATITLTDANNDKYILMVSDDEIINKVWENFDASMVDKSNQEEFKKRLDMGMYVSVF